MKTVSDILKPIIETPLFQNHKVRKNKIHQPVYWSMDPNGNILFDVESMRDELEYLLSKLQEHNQNSDFDMNNDD